MTTLTKNNVSEIHQQIVSLITRSNQGYTAVIVPDADGGEKVVVYPPASYVTSEGLEILVGEEITELKFESSEYSSAQVGSANAPFSTASFAARILDDEEQDAVDALPLKARFYHGLANFAQTRFLRAMSK